MKRAENDVDKGLCNKKQETYQKSLKFPLTGVLAILLFTAFPKIMKTTLATKSDHTKSWYVVDAANETLGRVSVKIANVLRGRHKPTYTPHADTGDFVVVINAEKIRVSGKKNSDKSYMFYSGWMGGESHVTMAQMREKKPEFIIEHSVKGMLPRNILGRQMIKKLKIHTGPTHPYEAQQPKPLV